jgi:hypothetical protein
LLSARGIDHLPIEHKEPIKGMEILGSHHLLHKLIPPSTIGGTGPRYSEAYTKQREKLREEVQWIPIFGDLYPPIPMRENFISLDLLAVQEWRHSRTVTAMRYAATPANQGGEGKLRGLKAGELFARYNKGCILGNPGAGKTTILRHCYWQTLEDDPNAAILLVNCRDLRPENFSDQDSKESRRPGTIPEILQAVTHPFLFPGKTASDLTPKDLNTIATVSQELRLAWSRGQVTILLDALDETPGADLKAIVISMARRLFGEIKKAERESAVASNRFFLSARTVEEKHLEPLDQPVFGVEDMTAEQMQTMAQQFFAPNQARCQAFLEALDQDPSLHKIGITPLTTLLLMLYFRVRGHFNVRYATYELLLKFVLLELWEKIKSRRFEQEYQRADSFFEMVDQPDFLDQRPEIQRQIAGLAMACFGCLFERESDLDSRDIPEQELRDAFTLLLRGSIGGRRSEQQSLEMAKDWINDFRTEHLLIPAGHETYRFVHDNMMEFLAARHLIELPPRSNQFQEALQRTIGPSVKKELDTLPIACGAPLGRGYRLLEQLQPHLDKAGDELLLLAFRCLAEIEMTEQKAMHGLVTQKTRQAKQAQINRRKRAIQWVYTGLSQLVLSEDVAGIQAKAKEFARHMPLCQPTLAAELTKWQDGAAEVVAARIELLKTLLHPDRFAGLAAPPGTSGPRT